MNEKILYICSPLSAPTQAEIEKNMKKATMYCEMVSTLMNVRAIAPHAFLPAYFNDNNPAERKICLDFGLNILSISKGIVICGSRISSGMEAEIEYAVSNNIPLYFLNMSNGTCSIEDEKGVCLCSMQKDIVA